MQPPPTIPGVLEKWILDHAAAGQGKIYFRISADIPVHSEQGEVFIEIPEHGRRILILHPYHLTPVAVLCCEMGITMIQAL